MSRLIEDGKLSGEGYTHARMHRIEASDQLGPLSASSKLNTEWPFFMHLRDIGRETARAWLDAHAENVGVNSTLDLPAMFD